MDTAPAVILANGDLAEPRVLRSRLAGLQPPLVIAADGGSRHAHRLGLRVDVLIGDQDSIEPEELARLRAEGTQVITHPRDKEETDLELALVYATQAGFAGIVVLGAVGNRLDMTLANVFLLLHPALRAARVQLWQGHDTAFLAQPPGAEIAGESGDRVSLIPLGGEAQGVETRGMVFPLRGEALATGPARGISNRIALPGAAVRLTQGALLIVHHPARPPG